MQSSRERNVSLPRAISKLGVASRKQAEEMILSGRVTVNGLVLKNTSFRVDLREDKIKLDGEAIQKKKFIYLILNKPKGYVTTRSDELNRKTIYDLLKNVREWVFPVGRLDKDTTGLLLLTNDNKLGEVLTNPKSPPDPLDHRASWRAGRIHKTYVAKINKPVDRLALEKLRSGVFIDEDLKTLPAKVNIINGTRTEIMLTIVEGKNRQVRRMFESLTYKVIELKRIQIGPILLGNLELGCFRHLTKPEVEKLMEQK
ncbi:MAG: pseudouridine synthase [Bacteroidota bacterium]|nr:pseudouridine synthase [Bacteroidota bacterium]